MPEGRATDLVGVLRRRAQTHPDRVAYIHLADGENESDRATFGRVEQRAMAVAATLAEHCRPGDRVLLAYPSGPEFVEAFLGCLFAGVVAVPCGEPVGPAAAERFASIVADAEAVLVLAPEAGGAPAGRFGLPVIDTQDVPDGAAATWRPSDVDPDGLAFLQYTSGSTSLPRGVMVTHRNLMANERMIAAACDHDERSTFVSWLPLFHDMGMVANVLQPLYLGSTSVIMPPVAFLARPVNWLRAIDRYRGHTGGGPNFGYELCLRRVSDADVADLDLSSWRVAYNGAEPVRAATMRRFTERFRGTGFRAETFFPCYGMAETTLIITGNRPTRTPVVLLADGDRLRSGILTPAAPGVDAHEVAGSGTAVPGASVVVVDPESGAVLDDGRVGEIRVAGDHVAAGYWRRPELSAETMQSPVATSGPTPYLRTGDLGALRDGELFVTGRLKDLIIVRGTNHHPVDLELSAEQAHPALRPSCGAAFSVPQAPQDRVVLVYELVQPVDEGADPVELLAPVAAAVRKAVSQRHGVRLDDVVFVGKGGVRKTTSGKIRRQWCAQAYRSGELPVVAAFPTTADPGPPLQYPAIAALVAATPADAVTMLTDALVAGTDVGLTDPPAVALSVDSVGAVELRHRLQRAYGVDVDLAVLLGDVPASELARIVVAALDGRATAPVAAGPSPADEVDEFPLSDGQRAMWFEQQAGPEHTAYHLARALRLRGGIDPAALSADVAAAVRRHPMLGVRFRLVAGEVVNSVGHEPPAVQVRDLTDLHADRFDEVLAAEAGRPFDLLGECPIRITLYRRGPREHVLLLVAHHAAMDFWSLVVLLRELFPDAGDPAPAGPAGSFAAHVRAQRDLVGSPDGTRLVEHWRRRLGTTHRAVELPLPGPRPATRTFAGATAGFRVPGPVLDRLRSAGQSVGATVFHTVLTAYRELLHRYCDQEDILLGAVTAGREDEAMAAAVGCFVNVVPLRSTRPRGLSAAAAIAGSRSIALDALTHAGYPFARLVSALRPARLGDRAPLVQALLVMHREFGADEDGMRALALGVPGRLHRGGIDIDVLPVPRSGAQVDLSLAVAEIDGELVGQWEYRTDLLDAAAVEVMSGHLLDLLDRIATDPSARLDRIAVAEHVGDRGDRSGDDGPAYPEPLRDIGVLVRDQAQRTPDAVAVTGPVPAGAVLTYSTLLAAAEDLAGRLSASGVRPGDRVAILLERSVLLPGAYLAAWMCGAVPTPLDVEDPPARTAALIVDSAAVAVVDDGPAGSAAEAGRRRLGVPALAVAPDPAGPRRRRPAAAETHPEQPAYLLYTSGSSGRPKGVLVPHAALTNRLLWMQRYLPLRPGDRVLHKTPISFDVSLWELLWPLTVGAVVVMAAPGSHRDPVALRDQIAAQAVGTVHFVPSVLATFLDAGGDRPPALQRVICSGEALTESLCERVHAALGTELVNLYGPTEAAIDVTVWRCPSGRRGPVPIGRPIDNVRAAVRDVAGTACPHPVPGELHLGGRCLATAYLGAPAATAERFRPDPAGSGDRLYATGDLVRRARGGELEYLGRLDGQLKIAGVRVEPGEVAEALRRLDGVADAAVVSRPLRGAARLVGYVVGDAARRPDDDELARHRAALRTVLPATMVPAVLVGLTALPVTTNGKLDRGALPEPSPTVLPGAPRPPGTGTECALASVWRSTLDVPVVGLDDGFFDLGGDSLRAIGLVTAARAAGIDLTVTDLLAHPTIGELAAHLDGRARVVPAERPTVPPFALCPDADVRFPDGSVVDAYPITMAQRTLLFRRDQAGYEVYTSTVRVDSPLHPGRMRAAVRALVRRHAYLRSTLEPGARPEPLQLVHRWIEPALCVVDVSGLGAAEQESQIRCWQEQERTRAFDTRRGPLVRFTVHDTGGSFRLTSTSFALDGWCEAILLTEILEDHANGPRDRPPLRLEYADFVALEREAAASVEHRAFWARQLDGAEACRLPRWDAVPRPVAPDARQHRLVRPVAPAVLTGLRQAASRLGVPLRTVLLTAHLAAVRVWSGRADVVTGVQVNGRPERADGDRVVGVFTNILPFRVDARPGSWADLVAKVHHREAQLSPHRRYPLAGLQREHRAADLFDTLFVYTNFRLYEETRRSAGIRFSDVDAPDQTYVPFTAHANVQAGTGELRLLLEHDPRELSDEQVAAIADTYTAALRGLAEHPHRPWAAELSAIPADGPARPSDPIRTVTETIVARCRQWPDRIALTDGEQHLGYGNLLAAADRLASTLRQAGVGPETVVGLSGVHRVETVVGLLAILRAGGAYLPLDPGSPPGRAAATLVELGVRHLVAAPGVTVGEVPPGIRVIRTDEWLPGAALPPPAHPESLAAVLLTSGSTGTPKSVGVTHRAMADYLSWCVDAYGITGRTRALAHSPLSVDLTVTSLLGPLVAGGGVHLPTTTDPAELTRVITGGGISLLKITPSHLAALARLLHAGGKRSSASTVVVGGEALHGGHLDLVEQIAPRAVVVNEYGPTETTVGCCAHRVPRPVPAGPVSIGRPIDTARVLVVADGLPVPVGVTGELWIGGTGLARGYLGRPGTTAGAFVPDPTGQAPGARMYRSGDLVCRTPDSGPIYVGRTDDQLKIRGHRIEPGEIEHALTAVPGVAEAAVVSRSGRLVAFWVPSGPQPPDGDELAAALAGTLPPQLRPDRFVRSDSLPMTATGKIDRASLPDGDVRLAALVDRVERLTAAQVADLLAARGDGAAHPSGPQDRGVGDV